MPGLSSADHRVSPPRITIPRDYNAAHDLVERNLRAGRSDKTAFIDDSGSVTYGQLAERANRAADALKGLGLGQEDRIMLALLDTVDFPSVFLGAIKAGIVPIAGNTLLTTARLRVHAQRQPRQGAGGVGATAADVCAAAQSRCGETAVPQACDRVGQGCARQAVSGAADGTGRRGLRAGADHLRRRLLWLYSSGSTGTPKGTVHMHSHLIQTAELYARPVLGIREDDLVFSAAKLFFAYGLGNSLTFPMSVGATAILMAERPTPAAVFQRLQQHRPTIFYGVPTLFAALLASPDIPKREALNLRVCTSAGEALPADIGERWTRHFGVEILDGIGSTEMLHIFVSNRPGEVRYGTTGKAVPGYALRVVDDAGNQVEAGEIGELQINGPTSAACYWNNRAKSRATFMGDWTRSGDKYTVDEAGYYTYSGRTDDMLKVGGIYVSPFEVEGALLTHPDVLEVAVIGQPDEDQLIKPKAYIVTKAGVTGDAALAERLQQHVKAEARAVQISALGGVRQRVAEDRNRKNPAFQTARQVADEN